MLSPRESELFHYLDAWEEGDDYSLSRQDRWTLPMEFRMLFAHTMRRCGYWDLIHRGFFEFVVPTLSLDKDAEGERLIASYIDFLSSISESEWESSCSDSRGAAWIDLFELFARHLVGFAAHIRKLANPTAPGLAYPLLFLHTGVFNDAFDIRLPVQGFRCCSFKDYYGYDEFPSPSWLHENIQALLDILDYPRSLVKLRESGLIRSEENLALLRRFEQLHASDSSPVHAHLAWLAEFLGRKKPDTGEDSHRSSSS